VESNDHSIKSMDEIEKLADGLNHTYCTDHTQNSLIVPIPIEDIAEHHLGYEIDFVDDGIFSDPEILGGIDFEENKIYVNTSVEDHDGRYAFTIAHEIGHHVLHRDAWLKDNRDGNKEILCRDSRNKPQIELEADRFAAALLMPAEAIKNITSTISPRPKVNSIKQARGLASKIIKEGKLDNVSNTAMVNRLIDLAIISDTIGYQRGINSIYKRRSFFSVFLSRIFNKIS
jgi:Zn-dependent peptidase ImmA (M78 family)